MRSAFSERWFRAAAAATITSLGAILGGCGEKKLGPNVPASVTIVSGDSQTIVAGNNASAPLVAQINSTAGTPLPNVELRWAVVSGGGSLLTLVDTTNASGQAQTMYLSPARAGSAKVSASSGGAANTFVITVAADTIGQLTAYAGDGAAALVGYQLTLIARATDRFGNPMPGVNVAWSTSDGLLQLSSDVTDSTGKASNIVTVGPDTGKVAIVASSRFNAVTFTVSALQAR